MATLTFEPLISPSLWAFLALACGGLLVWYALRRPGAVERRRWSRIVALMALAIAPVLFLLLNPYWQEHVEPPGGKPIVTLLVDRSASMATPDAGSDRTRFDVARSLTSALVQQLQDRFETRIVTFAANSRPADLETLAKTRAEGAATDLAVAVSEHLEEGKPQGQALILLSDGIHNAGGQSTRVLEAVRVARALDAPIYTRTLGGEAEVRDLFVEVPQPQELAFVDQTTSVNVEIRRRGAAAAAAAVVLSAEGKEIGRASAPFDERGRASVRFDVKQSRPGLYFYEARVEPFPGELITANNAQTFLLRVVDEPIRVLLLEGKPYWDAKFLTRTLASDASIELDGVVRLAEGRYLRRSLGRAKKRGDVRRVEDWGIQATPAASLNGPDGLSRYQVVVLGRDAEVFLDDEGMARLRRWIADEGGALVCYRGAPVVQASQSLARLLPVRWSPARESRFHVQLTERGRELRWLPQTDSASQDEVLARLPTLARAEEVREPGPLAVVLATATSGPGGEASPVVTYQPYGSGRVVAIEGAGMWRWAFLPPEHRAQEAIYGTFWHSLMRWLATGSGLPPGKDLALRSDKIRYGTNEAVTATLLVRRDRARREAPAVELSGGSLKEPKRFSPVASGDEPGMFRVLFGSLPEGHYRARVVGRDSSEQVAFDVRNASDEQLDLAARPDLMARIARESGGEVLESGTPDEFLQRFQRHQARSRTEQVRRTPAWDRGWVLAAIFLIWASTWRLRRSSGLI